MNTDLTEQLGKDLDMTVKYVRVGELDIKVSTRGTGHPLLLIMGLGGHMAMWRPLERELHPFGFQTITFDAPGTGGSSGWKWPRRLPAIARVAEQVVTALGHDRVSVLGLSFGGAVAQQLAHQVPDRVDRLILAATMPGVGGVPGTPAVWLRLSTPRRYRDPEYFRSVAGQLYGGRSRLDDTALMTGTSRFASPPTLDGYLNQLYAIQGWTSIPWLCTLRQPALVMTGDDDPIVPLINGRILRWLLPQAQLHIVREGGHLFLLENPMLPPRRLPTFFLNSARPEYDLKIHSTENRGIVWNLANHL